MIFHTIVFINASNFVFDGIRYLHCGILIIVSIFVWHLMLPDIADELDWARAPWLAVLSAALAIAAGFIGNKQLNESP